MSAKFTDTKGREYECIVTVGTVEKLKKELNVNLGNINDGQLFDRLSEDYSVLVDVISIVCEASISSHQITGPDDFANSLNGDVLAAAFDAFWDAVVLFSHPRKRKALRDLVERMKATEEEMFKKMAEQIAAIDVESVVSKAMELSKIEST